MTPISTSLGTPLLGEKDKDKSKEKVKAKENSKDRGANKDNVVRRPSLWGMPTNLLSNLRDRDREKEKEKEKGRKEKSPHPYSFNGTHSQLASRTGKSNSKAPTSSATYDYDRNTAPSSKNAPTPAPGMTKWSPSIEPSLSDPDFVAQLNRLSDLLPHVDKNILAGYLKRSGMDVLAIGQYLEDERMNTIRAPE